MFGDGTYTADGIKAIADSIAVTASVRAVRPHSECGLVGPGGISAH